MDESLARTLYSDIASGDTAAMLPLSDRALVQRMVDVEVALAGAVGDAGLVGRDIVEDTVRVLGRGDLITDDVVEVIAAASVSGGNPAIPLVELLKKELAVAGVATDAVHRGATSQDIIDTALVLCLCESCKTILSTVQTLNADLVALARRHRDTPVIGRTLGQQAVPTTFGVIAAGWVRQTDAAAHSVRTAVDALPVQYAGAAGNLSSTHPHGLSVHDALAVRLSLKNAPAAWHTDRLPLVQVTSALAAVAGAVRKIAGDVIFLSSTEVRELREATPGGSSAMPHKANPAAAVAADGYARRTPGLAATMLNAMDQRLQRATGAWHAEWQTLRDLAGATAGAVNRVAGSVDGIVVDTDAMYRNLQSTGGAVLAEALGRVVSREAVDSAVEQGTLGDLIARAQVSHGFSPDPVDHTGHAGEIVDRILAELTVPQAGE